MPRYKIEQMNHNTTIIEQHRSRIFWWGKMWCKKMKTKREKEALEDETQEEERKRGTDAVFCVSTRTQSSRGQLGSRHSCIKGKPTRVNLRLWKASKKLPRFLVRNEKKLVANLSSLVDLQKEKFKECVVHAFQVKFPGERWFFK